MRASARIVARCQPDGTTRLTTLAGEAPLLLRRTGPARSSAPGTGVGADIGTGTRAADSGHPDRLARLATPGVRTSSGVDVGAGYAAGSGFARGSGLGAGAGIGIGVNGPPPAQVHLVGGSAGPLGGDELRCSVDLGPGARLEVRSVAASVALPGPNGRESSLEILARIGEGAALSWSPRPLIAARGARHRTVSRVELAADARLVWRDELVLGRDGEEPGSVSSRLRVVRDGKVLLDHEIAMGPRHPGSLGPAGSGGHRALGAVLIVDPAWEAAQDAVASANVNAAARMGANATRSTMRPTPESARLLPGMPRIAAQDDPGVAVAVLRLSGPAVLISAAAADEAALRRILDSALG